jgi:orotidine-5'-phosphate decarboxylase
MHNPLPAQLDARRAGPGAPVPIVALDVGSASEAIELVDRLPEAGFFKVGLRLYTAEGPDIVRRLTDLGKRVFLDLKLHDIPNTVAGAVSSASRLGVDILTVHAAGGTAMLHAAAEAARGAAAPPKLFAVTILTSLSAGELADVWGRPSLNAADEAARLARMAAEAGLDGAVTAVHEVARIRSATRPDFPVLTPGIRLSGDPRGDQHRVAGPADAARLGVDFVVVGRSITAAADPAAAFNRVAEGLAAGDRTDR